MPFDYLFAFTAGRTGSAWLAKFISLNLHMPSVHEPLGIADFGVEMPDIRQLRSFNDIGWTREIDRFWKNKLARIGSLPAYAESNHVLGKAGLIEALAEWEEREKTAVICLTRDPVKQISSYLTRADFVNVVSMWQWYLHPQYRNTILNPDPFLRDGQLGLATWYALEMQARDAYYRQSFADRIAFVGVDLEDLVTPLGAAFFLASLERPDLTPTLPPQTNANAHNPNADALREKVAAYLERVDFDAEALAGAYIAAGRRLDAPGAPASAHAVPAS